MHVLACARVIAYLSRQRMNFMTTVNPNKGNETKSDITHIQI